MPNAHKQNHLGQRFKRGRVAVVCSAVALPVVLTVTLAGPAHAEVLDISDAQSVLSRVTPEVLATTSQQTEVSVGTSAAARSSASGSASTTITLPEQEAEPGSEEIVAEGLSLSFDYATVPTESSGDISVLAAEEISDLAAYVQPIPSGVRILTVVGSADAAAESFDYTIDVPVGTRLDEGEDFSYLIGPDNVPYGALAAPWARDASGTDLKTSYEWDGNTLTQHVEYPADVRYPVVIDPNWTYTHYYSFGGSAEWNTPNGVYSIRNAFKNCFNCLFPIPGAPAHFPSQGEILPLWLSLGWSGYMPFECVYNGEHTRTDGYSGQGAMAWGFNFDTTENHIHGEYSNIHFEWYGGPNNGPGGTGYMQMVHGYVVKDFPLHLGGNAVFTAGSKVQWQILFDNVKNHFS